jgi:predicted SAM-dependent methyltransferase
MMLNLGSGNEPLQGFTNVDPVEPADIVGDFTEMDFQDVEQVEMCHVLEHLPFRNAQAVMERVRSWMAPGGILRVEVPDAMVLAQMDPHDGNWNQWMFGSQDAPGQFHCAGYTERTLTTVLQRAGWQTTGARVFLSENRNRVGYPCLEVTATT